MSASRSAPIRGAVAAGHEETARSAALILEAGGNAFDAALAAMMTACVAEPVLASPGGGGFFLAEAAADPAAVQVFDFFVQTPVRRRAAGEVAFFPIDADFGETLQEFHIGVGAAATPGFWPGVFAIWRAHASLPLDVIAEPAIRAARDGVRVSAYQAYLFGVVSAIYTRDPASLAVFGGGAPSGLAVAGDIVRNAELADLIETVTREGERFARSGDLAQRIAAFSAGNGGHLTAADLARYRVVRRAPMRFRYGDAELAINPPPSTGGVLIAFALQLLNALRTRADGPALGDMAHVMALTNRAREESGLRALNDAAFSRLIDPGFVARYKTEVEGRPAAPNGTTHISVIDAEGNAAAATLSNGEGCGAMLPGTGFMLNNMLGEEDINPAGFHRWSADVRMSSMMAPGLLRMGDGALLAMGSGGSNRIRTAILQVVDHLVGRGMPLADAIAKPRLHVEGGMVSAESPADEPLDEAARRTLEHSGNRLQIFEGRSMFFGGVHAVRRGRGGSDFEAVGDSRRAGVGVTL